MRDNVNRKADRRFSISETEKNAIRDAIGLALSKMSMSDIHRMLHEQNMDAKRIAQSHSAS